MPPAPPGWGTPPHLLGGERHADAVFLDEHGGGVRRRRWRGRSSSWGGDTHTHTHGVAAGCGSGRPRWHRAASTGDFTRRCHGTAARSPVRGAAPGAPAAGTPRHPEAPRGTPTPPGHALNPSSPCRHPQPYTAVLEHIYVVLSLPALPKNGAISLGCHIPILPRRRLWGQWDGWDKTHGDTTDPDPNPAPTWVPPREHPQPCPHEVGALWGSLPW